MRLVIYAIVIGGLTGCSGLVIKPEDSRGEVAGKVTARVLMWPPTLGASEAVMETEALEYDLNGFVGNRTYDDAIITFGPPIRAVSTDTMTVADWRHLQGMGPIWWLIEAMNPLSLLKDTDEVGTFDMTLRMTFDPQPPHTLRKVEFLE